MQTIENHQVLPVAYDDYDALIEQIELNERCGLGDCEGCEFFGGCEYTKDLNLK
jgi:hypothetical protein